MSSLWRRCSLISIVSFVETARFPRLCPPLRLTTHNAALPPSDKDPITRAKSSLLAFQYESTVSKAWSQLAMQSSGDDESIEGFLNAIKGVIPYIDDALLSTDEYGVGDILIAPFVVSCTFCKFPRLQVFRIGLSSNNSY